MTAHTPAGVLPAENRPLTSIRGLAASWVFAAHTAVAFRNFLPPEVVSATMCGWLGVDIFFVLSGFILTKVYGGLQPSGIPAFWTRRVFRLFPLNFFVMAVIAAVSLAGFTFVRADWHHVLWHLFMMQSFVPGHVSGWLFVNWSVGIELICYIAFPIVVMAIAGIKTPLLLGVALIATGLCWWGETQVLCQFFGWPALQRGACGFMLGVIASAVCQRIRPLSLVEAGLAELAGLAGIIYGAIGGVGARWCITPGSWQMGLVPLAACLLIIGLNADRGPFARLLRIGPLFWIGRVSYSIYMLHMLVINGTRPVTLWLTGGHPRLRYIALWAMCAYAMTNMFAAVTFLCVEQPGRRAARTFLLAFRTPTRPAAASRKAGLNTAPRCSD